MSLVRIQSPRFHNCRWFPARGGLAYGEKSSRPDSLPAVMHYVYILYSLSQDRFYIGESADPKERLEHHRARDQRYTRRAADWILVFQKSTASRHEALKIKQLIKKAKSRKTIVRWIHGPDNQILSAT